MVRRYSASRELSSVLAGPAFGGAARMAEVKVAVLGGAGWMGKVHTMAYQTFPHFLGVSGGSARVVIIVEANPNAAEDLAPGAKILQEWKQAVNDPNVDLID